MKFQKGDTVKITFGTWEGMIGRVLGTFPRDGLVNVYLDETGTAVTKHENTLEMVFSKEVPKRPRNAIIRDIRDLLAELEI